MVAETASGWSSRSDWRRYATLVRVEKGRRCEYRGPLSTPVSRVIQEVEVMADCKIRDVYTGIAGSHIRSFNSSRDGCHQGQGSNAPWTSERVIEVARAMPIPADQQILHILTQEFYYRRTGWRTRTDWYERRSPGSEGPTSLPVPCQPRKNLVKCVRRLRTGSDRLSAAATGFQFCDLVRRRKGTWRLSGGYRWWAPLTWLSLHRAQIRHTQQ